MESSLTPYCYDILIDIWIRKIIFLIPLYQIARANGIIYKTKYFLSIFFIHNALFNALIHPRLNL